MRAFFRFALIVLLASGFALARAGAADGATLEVLSFNIRYPNLADGKNYWGLRVRFVAEVLLADAPDVVGLQEAMRGQLDDLKPHLAGYAEIGVGRDDGKTKGEYSAILYKAAVVELLESGTFWLSDTPEVPGSMTWGNKIPRICTWARFRHRASGAGFYHFNAHWDHMSDASRRRSGAMIAERIAKRSHAGEAVILTGDFNCGEKDAALVPLRDAGLVDTFRVLHADTADARTYHDWKGGVAGDKIDYVWVQPGAEVGEAEIVRTERAGRFPSDHYPVRARVVLPAR